jgi:Methyltransferase domain
MLDLSQQIALGKLVCPLTRSPLVPDADRLRTVDGKRSYPFAHGVPVLLADPNKYAGALAVDAGAMVNEYSAPPSRGLRRLYRRLLAAPGDQRTAASRRAFEALLHGLPKEALCVSVGGGPTRVRPEFVNVNVGAFSNVDVVADAYELPYADQAVDLIHCEAVLEHLEFPERAAAEMFRVLRAGGAAFVATPFLQPYHAYPDHFQNFTLSGHRRLFERAGFRIQEAGTCVGPTFVLRDLFLNYLREVMPGGALGRWSARLAALATLPLLQLDRIAALRAESSRLASSTYLVLRRAGSLRPGVPSG